MPQSPGDQVRSSRSLAPGPEREPQFPVKRGEGVRGKEGRLGGSAEGRSCGWELKPEPGTQEGPADSRGAVSSGPAALMSPFAIRLVSGAVGPRIYTGERQGPPSFT